MAHAEATALRPGCGRGARAGRPRLQRHRSPASWPPASRWASARPATSRPRSRRWPSGSRSKERAFATGIFNSGTNVGALVDAAGRAVDHADVGLVLGVRRDRRSSASSGWPSGGCSIASRRTHPRLSPAELAYIRSDPAGPHGAGAVAQLLRHRQTWAFAIGKFLTDPVWWLYLFWIPDFLNRNYGIDLLDDRPAAGRHLSGRRRRQHRRRLAVVVAHQARLDRESRAQDRDAALRARRRPDGVRVGSRPAVAGGGARRPRGGRASGLVGESLHAGVRHVSAAGGRVGGRVRRHGRARSAAC